MNIVCDNFDMRDFFILLVLRQMESCMLKKYFGVLTLCLAANSAYVQASGDLDDIVVGALFNISQDDIDDSSSGAHMYNPWGGNPSSVNKCMGYDGGHSGFDAQTKDVVGAATADREFYSLSEGKVIEVRSSDNGIFIYDDDKNITTIYLHADSVNVTKGSYVHIGDLLGIQGEKGHAQGEHVHYEVRSGKRTSAACGAISSLDPMKYLLVKDFEFNKTKNFPVTSGQVTYLKMPGISLPSGRNIIVELTNLPSSVEVFAKKGSMPSPNDNDIGISANPSNNTFSLRLYDGGEWYIGIRNDVEVSSMTRYFTIRVSIE